MLDPVIVFLIAWLLLQLTGEFALSPEMGRVVRVLIICVALVLIIFGAHGWALR